MSVISVIRSDFKEYYIWLRNYLHYRRHAFKMSLAIKMADIKQKAFNRQYHVMILEVPYKVEQRHKDKNGVEQKKEVVKYQDKLVSVCRADIERFKRKKWIPKPIGMLELKRTSIFYSTHLEKNNTASAEERKNARERYLKYVGKI